MFLIADQFGDVPARTELGFYYEDTRYLSRYLLRLTGMHPTALSARALEYNQVAYYLTNPPLPGIQQGTVTIARTQQLAQELTETIVVTNYGDQAIECTIDLEVDGDFAHVFDVKHAVEIHADDAYYARQRQAYGFTRTLSADGQSLHLQHLRGGVVRALDVSFSQPAISNDGALIFPLRLASHAQWTLEVHFRPQGAVALAEHQQGADHRRAAHAAMLATAPRLLTDSVHLQTAYDQSVRDFAALRLDDPAGNPGEYVLAAGIPWFMTLFGRDSLITAYQVLPYFPEAAKGILRALARQQGTRVDTLRAEEPGKILHELRANTHYGETDEPSIFPYYGTIDATPLFVMLLAAVYRVTGDREFVRSLRAPMVSALAWLNDYGDRDGDGYLEYFRPMAQGLANQGWKDSGDSVRFADGKIAHGAIALCEVQGYAYAARLGAAEIFDALGEADAARAERGQAAALRARFNRDFWMADRDYVALALDGEKRQVTALTSNPGHLLWTGILDDPKAESVARGLLADPLFAGWGIRTMARGEGGYSPISYHNGSIWPHDNSLIINGLARYGFAESAARVADGLIAAIGYAPDHRLPELFAGFDRDATGFPVEYPAACRPQAWAAGAILLIATAMTGFDASVPQLHATPFLPEHLQQVRLDGLWIEGKQTTLTAVRQPSGAIEGSQQPANTSDR